jgi:hypothetical protein
MAKKKVNRSALIRDYLKDHPDAGPTEVMQALAESKVKVSATHVSNVKSRIALGAEVGVRAVGRPRKVNGGSAINRTVVQVIQAAGEFVAKVGGIESARKAINVYAELEDSFGG